MTRKATHGLVIGGGFAGILAAAALSSTVDDVTVLDRDRFPDTPALRSGIPQGHHAHVLMSGGAQAVDALLPGATDALIAYGARRIGMPDDIATLTPHGWLPACGRPQFMISCSRALVDRTLRERLGSCRVRLVEDTETVGLLGDAQRVTGVRARPRHTGKPHDIEADIVVLAAGRSTPLQKWLTDLGLPEAREDTVDSGLAYATRLYDVPNRFTDHAPAVNIQLDPASDGRGGVLLPIEGDRWIATMMGMRGSEPPTDEDGFEEFARSLRHSLIAQLLESAAPKSAVRGFRATSNRQRHLARAGQWPDGLVVLGDAACTFNPSYGHGMSVIALGAKALGQTLARHGGHPGSARRAQHAVARTTRTAWAIATSQDLRRPTTAGPRPNALARLHNRYLDRVGAAALVSPPATRALLGVYTLSSPPTRLIAPSVLLAVARSRPRPTH